MPEPGRLAEKPRAGEARGLRAAGARQRRRVVKLEDGRGHQTSIGEQIFARMPSDLIHHCH